MVEDYEFRDEELSEKDLEIESRLRPAVFSDFDGQKKIVENLKIFVEAGSRCGFAGCEHGGIDGRDLQNGMA